MVAIFSSVVPTVQVWAVAHVPLRRPQLPLICANEFCGSRPGN